MDMKFMRRLLLLLAFFVAAGNFVKAQQTKRLNQGWEFLKGDLGGIWEAMRPVKEGSSESVPIW